MGRFVTSKRDLRGLLGTNCENLGIVRTVLDKCFYRFFLSAELTAVDNDKHDRLSYWVHKQPTGHARSPLVDTNEAQDGSLFFMQDRALLAQTNLDEGKYHVTVKVTDGIHTDNGNVSVIVQRVTHDMLMNAVTMKLAEMTPNDFLSAYLVLFQTLMTMTVFKSSNNIQVSILSIQETSNRDLDVLFCVFERLPSGEESPVVLSKFDFLFLQKRNICNNMKRINEFFTGVKCSWILFILLQVFLFLKKKKANDMIMFSLVVN